MATSLGGGLREEVRDDVVGDREAAGRSGRGGVAEQGDGSDLVDGEVVEEVAGWEPPPAERIRAIRAGMAAIAELGIEAMD